MYVSSEKEERAVKDTGEFSFLRKYIGATLTAIGSTPYWMEKKHLTSSNTVIVSTTAGPLSFACAYYQADLFYDENEDVLFSVKEGESDIEYTSLDGIPLETEKRDETILDISLVYDEVTALDRKANDKTLRYPVAVFFHTDRGTAAVWRDSMDVFLLGYDGKNATLGELWNLDELWDGFLSVPPFSVKRCVHSFGKNETSLSVEKKYYPPEDAE